MVKTKIKNTQNSEKNVEKNVGNIATVEESADIIKHAVIIIVIAIIMTIYTFTCLATENFDFDTLGMIIIGQSILFILSCYYLS